MKLILTLLTFGLAFSSFAQRNHTIDDLSTIGLNLDTPTSEAHDIHYPNYRMGGGNGAGREINDCLILDIRHSDAVVTLEEKLTLAKDLKVLTGFGLGNGDGEGRELTPIIKGSNVVFPMEPLTLYVTFLQVRTRDDARTLDEVIRANLPSVRDGNTLAPPTGLVYVRDCRF
jgi:hypothetical protein